MRVYIVPFRITLGEIRIDNSRNEYMRGTAQVERLGDKVGLAVGHGYVEYGAVRQEERRKTTEKVMEEEGRPISFVTKKIYPTKLYR